MPAFPVALLHPLVAHLSPSTIHAHGADLEIELAPFVLGGAPVRTAIRLDGMNLPTYNLEQLAGRRLVFPLNPEPGYIDGSLYFDGRHHAVDIRELCFGKLDPHGLPVRIEGRIHFDDGARFDDTALSLAARIARPLSDAEIDALIDRAAADAGVGSIQQSGKVMAALSRHPSLRHADMALLHARVQARLLIGEAMRPR
ncbi:GatB/YqeY domain-containing protein [Cupriavidus basilensis]|uniref:GatB/YqeY domain-containing protein n=1 Tax=Cupriavidus basilensis TaxID=68895 RepID=A0A643FI01_9BURK|nr:GatB/YqeY domain-containing protein [Cupriavidus basilensis]QOT76745.1 GatB/YqeY domain-containing protein [Cupriavidus basilensis]